MGARKINPTQQGESRLSRVLATRHAKTGLVLALLLACVFLIVQLYQPDTLPFKKIQVYGELQYMDKNKLDALVLSNINGGFFSLDVNGLKSCLEKQAWIKTVAIRRVWPDVLRISVTEQQPVAIWNNESVINREGEMFAPEDERLPEYLVKVSGPLRMQRNLMQQYFALQGLLQTVGLRISSISANDRRALRLMLNNGVQLLMGRVHDAMDSTIEMRRFVKAYQVSLAAKQERISLVDLRYTNGLAVRWKKQIETSQQNQIQRIVGNVTRQG